MQRKPSLRPRKSLVPFGVAALLAMSAATAQVAGGGTPGTTGLDATGNFQSEVQACHSGRTLQDRDTCLREARNARAEKQRGKLDTPANHEANARARCEPLSGEDKAACEARVMGYGNASGSVAGGGVLREVETVAVPPGATEITIRPQTTGPVVVVPAPQQ